MSYIYKITNKVNSKSYIGKTEYFDPIKRFKEHKKESKKDRHKNRPLYRAMRKYGCKNFDFLILEKTDNASEREMYYIEKFKTFGRLGYNATKGGDGRKLISYSDEEIIGYFNEVKSMKMVSEKFGFYSSYTRLVLKRNNVKNLTRNEVAERRKLPVVKMDKLTGEVLEEFNSLKDAGKSLGCEKKAKSISKACKGINHTAYGYKWDYK